MKLTPGHIVNRVPVLFRCAIAFGEHDDINQAIGAKLGDFLRQYLSVEIPKEKRDHLNTLFARR